MTNTLIQELRAQRKLARNRYDLGAAKRDFDMKKREEWSKVKSRLIQERELAVAEIDLQIAKEVWRLRKDGVTITEICEMYGSKDRGTILRLEAEGRRLQGLSEVQWKEASMTLTRVKNDPFPREVWRFDVRAYKNWTAGQEEPYSGTIDVYADEDGFPVPVPDRMKDVGNPLHIELVRGNESGEILSAWNTRMDR